MSKLMTINPRARESVESMQATIKAIQGGGYGVSIYYGAARPFTIATLGLLMAIGFAIQPYVASRWGADGFLGLAIVGAIVASLIWAPIARWLCIRELRRRIALVEGPSEAAL